MGDVGAGVREEGQDDGDVGARHRQTHEDMTIRCDVLDCSYSCRRMANMIDHKSRSICPL